MTAEHPHLLMVYNADGGVFAMVSDAVHKVLSPDTYPCSLCMITYGAVSMKREWRVYLERLPARVTFHHRDDFAAAWPGARFELPVILRESGGQLSMLVSASELDAVETVEQLSALVDARLAQPQRV
ncbi:hypothetical protein A6F68_02804 [Tsuneonella dongtanensis]|uniref:GTPase n=1 Tax=Tsuneonella dongtanensis TaxID=692370 RepID=A0A1B2AGK9_9SPHN|nr:hypothetical protein [Tsuneonella dongtanensis]ANY21293.1 hypothetical protein A6F68_02804 [Tsuneonella dongtanensis]